MSDQGLSSESGMFMLRKTRETYYRLPKIEEKIDGFGHFVVQVNGKSFLIMGDGEKGLAPGMSIKSDKETQQLLIAQGHFFKTPYIGQHGWVSIKVDQIHDWDEIGQLVVEAYLRQAPKNVVQTYRLSQK